MLHVTVTTSITLNILSSDERIAIGTIQFVQSNITNLHRNANYFLNDSLLLKYNLEYNSEFERYLQ